MPVEMEVSPAAIAAIIDRLRSIVPNLGDVYFVDSDAGVDAPGRGTYALPLLTIDYAVSNYATAWANDAFICWSSAGGVGFNENVNLDGVQVDVPSTVICAYNNVRINNTIAGALSVFHVTAAECWILGFTVQPTVATMGIDITAAGTRTKVGYDESFYNVFSNCTEDVRNLGAGSKFYYNHHDVSLVGYDLQAAYCEIKNNVMHSVGGAGTFGITTGGTGDNNYIRDNIIFGYNTGINMVAGAIGNFIAENNLFCTANIADANGVASNAWVHNKSRSLISHTNTVQQDLKDIFDLGGGGPGPGPDPSEIGDVFFVSTTGSNATGDGSLGDPWATIDFAVGNCVANHNDMIAVWSPNGANFDENANANGVICDVAGVRFQGIGFPGVRNTNVGAARVFYIRTNNVHIAGFRFDDTPPPAIPIIDEDPAVIAHGTHVHDNIFEAVQIPIQLHDGIEAKIYNNKMYNPVTNGVVIDGASEAEIFDNYIFRPGQNAIYLDNMAMSSEIHDNRLYGDNTGTGINLNSGQHNVMTNNWAAHFNANYLDISTQPNAWIDNHQDHLLFNHTVQVADGVANIVLTGLPTVKAKAGKVTVNLDSTTLDVAEIGKVLRLSIQVFVNAAWLPIAFVDHRCGIDILHPSITADTSSGIDGAGNFTYQALVQMNAAVAGARLVRYDIVEG